MLKNYFTKLHPTLISKIAHERKYNDNSYIQNIYNNPKIPCELQKTKFLILANITTKGGIFLSNLMCCPYSSKKFYTQHVI